jgi:hypothetical protein
MNKSLLEISTYSPIIYHMSKCNLSKADLCRLLDITYPTLSHWLGNIYAIPFGQLVKMSGLFGLPIEALVYCLVRSKPKVKGKKVINSNSRHGVSYLEEIRHKHKDL